MALAALSSSQGNVVGVALGLIVGLVMDIWLVALLYPALRDSGMPGVAKVSANLVGILATAAGSKWASEAILSDLDYEQILAPYLLTVAITFVTCGFALLAWVVAKLVGSPGPAT